MATVSRADVPVPFAARADRIVGSIIDRSISELQRAPRDTISFSMGSVAPAAFPVNILREAASETLSGHGAAALNYAPTEGDHGMRSALRRFLESIGTPVADEELLITSGGMQGLDLAFKLFIGPGDLAVVESPTYTNGTAAIGSYDGDILVVPTDGDGLLVDVAQQEVERIGRRPRLFLIIPNFQNPSGVTLSLERRVALLELAEECGALVVEDDPYGWLGFDGEQLPSLYELDAGQGRVVAVRTFSKIMAPGLRVGWVQAPAPVIELMIAAKQGMDTCANVLGQRLIAEFLAQGLMESHLAHLREEFRANKDAMQHALERCFRDVAGTEWTDPGGGCFLWLRLPSDVDGDALAVAALAAGVAVIPGSAFSLEGEFRNAVRLSFSAADRGSVHEGVRRLRLALDRVRKR